MAVDPGFVGPVCILADKFKGPGEGIPVGTQVIRDHGSVSFLDDLPIKQSNAALTPYAVP